MRDISGGVRVGSLLAPTGSCLLRCVAVCCSVLRARWFSVGAYW